MGPNYELIREITTNEDSASFLKIAKQFQLSTFDIDVKAIDMDSAGDGPDPLVDPAGRGE